MIKKAIIGIFVISLSLSCGNAFAQLANEDLPNREGIRYHDVVFHGAVAAEEIYDSNVYLANTDRKADGINVISPSVGIELPFGNNMASFDFEPSMYIYDNFHHENHLDYLGRGLIELNLAECKVTVKDIFNRFTDRASNENSVRLREVDNDFRVGLEVQRERLGFDIGYTNRIETYGSNDITRAPITYDDRDRDNNIIDATVSWRFMPKTLFLVENDLGFIHYLNTSMVPDSWYDEILLGLKGEWFSKMNINFKAGLRGQSYDDSTVVSDKGYVGPEMRGGLDYHPTENDTVRIDVTKTLYESTYSNINYYDANVASFVYRHDFSDKIYGTIFGSYQLHLYPSESTENGVTQKRHDNFLIAGTSLRYDIRKWVSAEARYEYTWKSSNFDIFDYTDNVISIRGTVGF